MNVVDGINGWFKYIFVMGCAGIGIERGVKPIRLGDADALSRKRQMLVEYALRNKIGAIIDIVNLRTPFEIVKELSISIHFTKKKIQLSKRSST
jgi:hypothetical protein